MKMIKQAKIIKIIIKTFNKIILWFNKKNNRIIVHK